MTTLTDKPEVIRAEYSAPYRLFEEAGAELMEQISRGVLKSIKDAATEFHRASKKLDEEVPDVDQMASKYYQENRDGLYQDAVFELYIVNGLVPPAEESHVGDTGIRKA